MGAGDRAREIARALHEGKKAWIGRVGDLQDREYEVLRVDPDAEGVVVDDATSPGVVRESWIPYHAISHLRIED